MPQYSRQRNQVMSALRKTHAQIIHISRHCLDLANDSAVGRVNPESVIYVSRRNVKNDVAFHENRSAHLKTILLRDNGDVCGGAERLGPGIRKPRNRNGKCDDCAEKYRPKPIAAQAITRSG